MDLFPSLVPEVLADRTRRAIFGHVQQQGGPVSVNDVAQTFDMHRNAAKFHLDKLLDAGLLTAEFRRINGRQGPGAGRPSKLYSASDVELSFSWPDRRYELLSTLLLRALTSGAGLEEVGYAFGRELAEAAKDTCDSPDGLLCAGRILTDLGFDPAIERDEDGIWVTTRNCPFGKVAMEAPAGEVCRLDRAIVRGILETFSDKPIEVREHLSKTQGHDVCVRQVVS